MSGWGDYGLTDPVFATPLAPARGLAKALYERNYGCGDWRDEDDFVNTLIYGTWNTPYYFTVCEGGRANHPAENFKTRFDRQFAETAGYYVNANLEPYTVESIMQELGETLIAPNGGNALDANWAKQRVRMLKKLHLRPWECQSDGYTETVYQGGYSYCSGGGSAQETAQTAAESAYADGYGTSVQSGVIERSIKLQSWTNDGRQDFAVISMRLAETVNAAEDGGGWPSGVYTSSAPEAVCLKFSAGTSGGDVNYFDAFGMMYTDMNGNEVCVSSGTNIARVQSGGVILSAGTEACPVLPGVFSEGMVSRGDTVQCGFTTQTGNGNGGIMYLDYTRAFEFS